MIVSNTPGACIAAQSRADANTVGGYVFDSCMVTYSSTYGNSFGLSYLGRPFTLMMLTMYRYTAPTMVYFMHNMFRPLILYSEKPSNMLHASKVATQYISTHSSSSGLNHRPHPTGCNHSRGYRHMVVYGKRTLKRRASTKRGQRPSSSCLHRSLPGCSTS